MGLFVKISEESSTCRNRPILKCREFSQTPLKTSRTFLQMYLYYARIICGEFRRINNRPCPTPQNRFIVGLGVCVLDIFNGSIKVMMYRSRTIPTKIPGPVAHVFFLFCGMSGVELCLLRAVWHHLLLAGRARGGLGTWSWEPQPSPPQPRLNVPRAVSSRDWFNLHELARWW